MIEVAIRSLLLADPDVTAIVGSRIYPMRVPQGTSANIFPALVYQHISDFTEYALRDVGPIRARVQLTAWATSYDVVRDLSDKARLALETFIGQPFTGEDHGETIIGLFHRGGRDMPYEKDEAVYGHSQDFEVVHAAAVAA